MDTLELNCKMFGGDGHINGRIIKKNKMLNKYILLMYLK